MQYSLDHYTNIHHLFCFPYYWYPLFVFASWISFYFIIKLLECFHAVQYSDEIQEWQKNELSFWDKTTTDNATNIEDLSDEEVLLTIQTHDRNEILKCLMNNTILPMDINKIIVNNYLFDHQQPEEQKYLILNGSIFNQQLKIKNTITVIFMLIYFFVAQLLQFVCLFIIVVDVFAITGWNMHKSWAICILLYHPIFKNINYLYYYDLMHSFFVQRKGNCMQCIVGCLAMLYGPGFLFHLGAILFWGAIVLFTVIIPSLFIYLPFTLFSSFILYLWYKYYHGLQRYPFVHGLFGVVLVSIFYSCFAIIMPSTICVYDGDNWFECLYYNITSQYCPNINIHPTNWKSIVLLVSWILI